MNQMIERRTELDDEKLNAYCTSFEEELLPLLEKYSATLMGTFIIRDGKEEAISAVMAGPATKHDIICMLSHYGDMINEIEEIMEGSNATSH